MQRIHLPPKLEAAISLALITLASFVSYGVLIPRLGYYRDDWYLLWSAQALGPEGILSLFKGDRPILGWLYVFDYRLLGASPLGWHIYAFLLRLAGSLAFWWLLRTIWPEKRTETTLMSLLFVVYPGFYQQPDAATFKNLILAYAAAMLSIVLTLKAVRAPSRLTAYLYIVISLALAAVYLLIYEALLGLEVVRFMLLWYVLRRSRPLDLKGEAFRILKAAAPYLILTVAYLVWRLFFFSSTRRATSVSVLLSGYEATPVHSLLFMVIESVKDWLETTFFAWAVPFYQFIGGFRYRDVMIAFALALIVVVIAAAYYLYFSRKASEEHDPASPGDPARDWIWLGALSIVITTIPVILAGRNVIFAIQWDRYTFQSLIGVAFFLGGIAFYSMRGSMRWVFVCGLIAIGVMTQYFSGAFYRDFWAAERAFWWQLSWRAPSIRSGTTLIASLPGAYQLAEEYEVWAPLNLAYSTGGAPMKLVGQIPFPGISIPLERGTVEQRLVRGTALVNRDYNQVLVASLPTTSACLHLIDGANPQLSLAEPDYIARIARYSRPELLELDASPHVPPAAIFGPEPPRTWCYYYQKIGLALQQGNWTEAARLADESLANDLRPEDQSEWMPVVEAYVNAMRDRDAKQAARFISERDTHAYLCQQLRQVKTWPEGYRFNEIMGVMCGQAD